MEIIKLYKIDITLTEEKYEELLERLECEEYNYMGEEEQEEYEKSMRRMRDEIIYQIKKNLITIYEER